MRKALGAGIGCLALLVLAVPLAAFAAAQNTLDWTDNSTTETRFTIERKAEACAGSGGFMPLASVGADVTQYIDPDVVEGATYCYRVNAGNALGVSAYSNTAERTVPIPDTTPPTLTVVRPRLNGVYASSVTPGGSVTDASGIAAIVASLDGVPKAVTLTGTTWSMVKIRAKGGHALTVTASDPAGNLRQITVPFTITGGK
jgi:hypothetical protein